MMAQVNIQNTPTLIWFRNGESGAAWRMSDIFSIVCIYVYAHL